jgi:predicted transcriptional regulator
MEIVPITDWRIARLAEYAQRRGQDTAAALDIALAEYLAWERSDFQEAVEGIREGFSDLKAGLTQSAEEMFEEPREEHGLAR